MEPTSEALPFSVAPDRMLASWRGPIRAGDSLPARVQHALEYPNDGLPPLRQRVVPGDRVTVVLDPTTSGCEQVLQAVLAQLDQGGVTPADTTILTEIAQSDELRDRYAPQFHWQVHQPAARDQLAYLAATRQGRRIYLNRAIVDADVAIVVGPIERTPERMLGPAFAREGVRGPSSSIFPCFSDDATRTLSAGLERPRDSGSTRTRRPGGPSEAREVCLLLGNLFEVGILPGQAGVAAGRLSQQARSVSQYVRDQTRFEPRALADLAVAQVGGSLSPPSWVDLICGVLSAVRLVHESGNLAVVCPLQEAPGPAISALARSDDPRGGPGPLRGLSAAPDYLLAAALASLPRSRSVALWSPLDPELVEGLGFVPLSQPKAIQRMIDRALTVTLIHRPEITGIRIPTEEPAASN